jgi:hypothetical protein
MNATGKRRLLKLADFLETKVPPDSFNMSHWGRGDDAGKPQCGTTACALGWASAIPSLRKAGVRLAPDGGFVGDSPWGISQKVFGLNLDQHSFLFDNGQTFDMTRRRGVKVVAKRIRKLVASKAA